jgi:CDP-diacylglycerol--serine O-phosphatidyltransferase
MAGVADAVFGHHGPNPPASWSDPAITASVLKILEVGALLVFVAMIFDSLDGKVARLTRQTSDFGAQLDSLADAITFGVAPAVLAKALIDFHAAPKGDLLPRHPRLYYLASALYVLCAVMRLARFNVETESHDEEAHREFVGLPSPAAAGLVASLVCFFCAKNTSDVVVSQHLLTPEIYDHIIRFMPWTVALAGLLMVSRLPYPHFANWLFRGGKSFLFLWTAVFILVLAALEWQLVLLSVSVGYASTGPLLWLSRLLTGKPSRRRTTAIDASGADEPGDPGETDPPDADADGDRGRGFGAV